MRIDPVAETSAAFSARGALVARAGITVNFGTVADYTSDPASFIHGRALGIDSAAEYLDHFGRPLYTTEAWLFGLPMLAVALGLFELMMREQAGTRLLPPDAAKSAPFELTGTGA